MMRSHHLMSRTSEAGSRFFHGVTSPEATTDGSGTLSPSEGERDGVRGPLAGSGAQCAHKIRGILSPSQRVSVKGNQPSDDRHAMYLTNRSNPAPAAKRNPSPAPPFVSR